jgi:hypothetical protein
VGEVWQGCPATYGYGAALAWGALTGWALSFGWGWYDPWYDPWWGPWAGNRSGYYYPWAYGGAVTANVYGHWGNSVVGGTAAAWANPRSGNMGRVARGAYNPVTGGRGYGYAGPNTNAYLGIISAAAGGVRYNPQPGRLADPRASGNARTGNGDALRAVVNINSGALTRTSPAAPPDDAAGAGRGPARAVTIRYDRDTGEINHGGLVDVNGRIYAGRDGSVYRCDENGWSKAGADGRFVRSPPAPGLDMELLARTRGVERDLAGGNGFERSNALANFAGLQRISSTSFGGGGTRFSNGR